MEVHYTADPEKRHPEWIREVAKGVPIAIIRREYEMDDTIHEGEPVFPEYHEPMHVPEAYWDKDFPFVPGSIFIAGWDPGLQPAVACIQVTPVGQIQVFTEVAAHNAAMLRFGPMVMYHLQREFPHFIPVDHVGDPYGGNRGGGLGESPFDVARVHCGIRIRSMTNAWEPRRSAIVWALTNMIDHNTPRMVINGKRCKGLIEGFRGLYRIRRLDKESSQSLSSRYADGIPEKNSASNYQDALQYAVLAAQSYLKGSATRRISTWQNRHSTMP